jgi:hypothetical protein
VSLLPAHPCHCWHLACWGFLIFAILSQCRADQDVDSVLANMPCLHEALEACLG